MDQSRHILDLADELLSEILSFLLESGSQVSNGRAHGNRYNGIRDSDQLIGHGEASDLDRFRLVCKRFMRIGTPRKFSRFILRFSEDGFRRLDNLLKMQLACYVKSVTYLVRPFYQGSGWVPMLRSLATEHPALSHLHSRRLREQNTLVEFDHDLTQLRTAIAAFQSLQEIKLLRLQDEADEQLINFIHGHTPQTTHPQPRFDWDSACSRAVTNLGIALLNSQCTSIRFTGPHISPEATLQLLQAPSTTLAAMASRLTSLDITFHSNTDMTSTMADLSDVLGRFFPQAKNLVALHIGFPSKHPLNLALDAIFHNTRWKTLHTLSLQGWRLADHELIDLARRHRRLLRDLRLCTVYLRPGGRWTDVLAVLRDEMERLDRLALHEIDYAESFDTLALADGVEVFDLPPAALTPSSLAIDAGTSPPESQRSALGADGPPALGCGPSVPQRELIEKVRGLTLDDLGDDGIKVRRDQIRLWEAWFLSATRRGRQNGSSH